MKKIVAVTKNPVVEQSVMEGVRDLPDFSADIFNDSESAIAYINYELPEIKVLDFADETLDCQSVLDAVCEDSWLHSGGIIVNWKKRKT